MKVTDIAVDKEQLEELESLLSRQENYFTSKYRRHLIKKCGADICSICGNIASKQVSYDVSDNEQKASRIERYCDKCFKQMQREEQTTLLQATNGIDRTIAVRVHKKRINSE